MLKQQLIRPEKHEVPEASFDVGRSDCPANWGGWLLGGLAAQSRSQARLTAGAAPNFPLFAAMVYSVTSRLLQTSCRARPAAGGRATTAGRPGPGGRPSRPP